MNDYLNTLNGFYNAWENSIGSYKNILTVIAIIAFLFTCFASFFGSTKTGQYMKIIGIVLMISAMGGDFFVSNRVTPLHYEPKISETKAIAKAHQEYPFVITYQVRKNNPLGSILGLTNTKHVLVKQNRQVPSVGEKITINNNDKYSLEKVSLNVDKSDVTIKDSRSYLKYKITNLKESKIDQCME